MISEVGKFLFFLALFILLIILLVKFWPTRGKDDKTTEKIISSWEETVIVPVNGWSGGVFLRSNCYYWIYTSDTIDIVFADENTLTKFPNESLADIMNHKPGYVMFKLSEIKRGKKVPARVTFKTRKKENG